MNFHVNKIKFTERMNIANSKSAYNQYCIWKLLLVIVCLSTKKVTAANNSHTLKDITLAGLFSLTGAGTSWGDCLIAAKFAINHINNDPRILDGYRLNLSHGNAEVNVFINIFITRSMALFIR